MPSSITSTIATRVLNEKKESIERALRIDGCTLRPVIENLADLIDSGAVRITGGGIVFSGQKIPENKKGGFSDGGEVEELRREINGLRKELESAEIKNKGLAEKIKGLEDEVLEASKNKASESFEYRAEDLTEIQSMAAASSMTLERLISDFREKLESGEIGLSLSGLTVGVVDECPFDWRQITGACDEMSLDYDDAVKKILPMLYRV